MSITDELREWAARELASWKMARERFDALEAIADRIDAEHESKVGCTADEWEYWESTHVELPKDADGEHIHVGDVMAYADNTKPMEVVALVPPAVFLTEDGPRYADMCRHYRKPTVEDVLREFAYGLGVPVADSYVAATAAKLRLKEDA